MTFFAKLAAAVFAATVLYTNASARPQLAPADEYFGRMKMSVLEIGNRINDLNRRNDDNIIHDAGLTEDAIRDWEHNYPADPWLSKDIASLVHIYAKLHTPAARRHVRSTTSWLQKRYAYYHTVLARHIKH